MIDFRTKLFKPERGDESGRIEGSKPHKEVSVIEMMEAVSPEIITLKLDIINSENGNSFESDQGCMKAHHRGDKFFKRREKQKTRREGERQDLDTLHQSTRSVQRGQFNVDSVTKSAEADTIENEEMMESFILKHIKSEIGGSIIQSGLTDADDQAEAFAALAAVMEVHAIPKVVVGSAADFPGDIGMYGNYQCRKCKKPEFSKNTIVCDKCQQSYHLTCVELKPNQATEKKNERWQCASCGPELEGQYWALGRITLQHDRKEADSKWDVSKSHADALEHLVVMIPDTDAAVEDDGNGTQVQTTPAIWAYHGHGGASNLISKIARINDESIARLACKENVMPVKRGRGRPRKDSTVLKDQVVINATTDMGIKDSGLSELQPALNFEFLGLSNSWKETKGRKDSTVYDTIQKLESPINPVDFSVQGFRSRKEKLHSTGRGELVEVSEEPILKNSPFVKESRTLPPAGELLTRRIPAELVGDTIQVWEFLCRFSDVLGWNSLTYEEWESSLVILEAPVAADTVLDVKIRNSLDLRSKDDSEKKCAVASCGSLDTHGEARPVFMENSCVGGTGVLQENGPDLANKSDDAKPEGSGCDTTALITNGLKHGKTTGKTRNSPQRTTLKEISDRAIGPADFLGLEVSATEVAVAFSDGILNEHYVMISTTHIFLLKLLLADLQFRISGTTNIHKSEEPKKKGRKPLHEVPQVPQDVSIPEFSNDLPINELTWPELIRRYLIALVEVEKYGDLTELKSEERKWLMRCLQGDGGVPCGALYTVVGVESDAQVLVEAEKELAIRLPNVEEVGEELDDPVDELDRLPQWVEVLKPVMRMATNVGFQIRNRVKEALKLGPPEWARDTLEWSISNEVFKNNASGPTKKAIMEVLKHFSLSPSCNSPNHKTKTKKLIPLVDELMQRCRVVLRTTADADKTDTFSILIGPEGCGSRRLRGMVARPLDFRTIDARLAAGAYGGSVDAFAEDVRQIWRNVELLQKGGDVVELASDLSQIFEELLQKQVLDFMNGISEVNVDELKIDEDDSAVEEKDNDLLIRSEIAEKRDKNKLQRAPWQDTDTCRVCGVDEDYESIMLCDKCDAEYHTYCLNPPLETVPDGTWFCPDCVLLDKVFPDILRKDGEFVGPVSLEGEEHHFSADGNMDNLVQTKVESPAELLLKEVEMKEYWQLGLSVRIRILKFLCEESLKTTEIRTHLKKSVDLAYDLQQQLSVLHAQWENSLTAIDEQGKQGIETVENLKSRPYCVNGLEATCNDSWSISLNQHSSAVLNAEDITPALSRLLSFDADGKEDKNSVERDATMIRFLDPEKAGKSDTVSVSNTIYEKLKSKELIKIEDARNSVIARNNPVNDPSSADLSVAALNCTVNATKRKHHAGAQEGDLMTEVGSRMLTASESVMTRNSKRSKFDKYNEDAQPAIEVMHVISASNQTVYVSLDKNLGAQGNHLTDHGGVELKTFISNEQNDKLHFFSELEGQTGAPGSDYKLGETFVRNVNADAEKVLGCTSSGTGTKSTGVYEELDVVVESQRKAAVRSSCSVPELPNLHGGSLRRGTFGAGFPPRTPKQKVEMVFNVDSRKKLKTDAQGFPAFDEVVNDPHRGGAFSNLQRGGLFQLPAKASSIPSTRSLKLYAEMMRLKLKLHNTALRRDHLGIDDIGRHYWALSGPDQTSMLVVSECDAIGGAESEGTEESVFSYIEQSVKNDGDGGLLGDHSVDKTKEVKTRWWVYQNEASIDSLLAWLNPRVRVELALKTSICNWLECSISKFYELLQESVSNSPLENLTDRALEKRLNSTKISKVTPRMFPALQATAILQMRHGPASSSDRVVPKRASLGMGGKVIRCSCLEPLIKFRRHCLVCHETYESTVELQSHKSVCTSSVGVDPLRMNQKATEKCRRSGLLENDEKRKYISPKKEGTERFSERDDTHMLGREKNVNLSLELSGPIAQRHEARSRIQPHRLESDGTNVIGNWTTSEVSVQDAFFLSDFQDDAQNTDVYDIEVEDLRMGFESFSSLLQDDEWEAKRSESKRKKPTSGKKCSKQSLIEGASEMTLANFDYASLPMNFSTPDSTRDRILQIGCIADQGPTFAPALHFAPAFDLSLMIKPLHPVFDVFDVQGAEFLGSSSIPCSQNDSFMEELYSKESVEGGLDAVSWYDPQTLGETPYDLIFAADTEDAEPIQHTGSGVVWDITWTELVGLPELESEMKYVSHVDGGCALDVGAEKLMITNNDMQSGCTLNTTMYEKDSFSGPLELSRAVDVTEVETVPSFDKLRPTSDLEPSDLAPFTLIKTQPLGTVESESSEVVPNTTTMKKPSKKFVVPEPSLRPLVGEQYSVLIGIKMRLLDMEAAMGADILIPSKSAPARRRAWRSLVKSALCIYEMTKSVILLEQMVRADCLKRTWCYWSSLSAAARSATLSSLALRIFSFDSAISYRKDKGVADDFLRSSAVKKSKKVYVQVPFSSKKKVNRVS